MKKLFILFVLMLTYATSVSAFDCEVDGICYNILSDNDVEVTANPEGYKGEVVIPTAITYDNRQYSVIGIGQRAFQNTAKMLAHENGNRPSSVTISEGIQYIGDRAFYWCNSLPTIIIPNSVTSIGSNAFYKCTNLTSLALGNNIDSIGNGAFSNCSSLESVTIPDKVKHIGESVFCNCVSLSSVSIGRNVSSIDNRAFLGCVGLTTLSINCENVGAWFNGISSITELSLGDNVKTIGNEAFKQCYNLKSVILSEGLISIGNSAFEYCQELTSINIPRNVSFIGEEAFAGCTSLSIINVDNENPKYDSRGNCNAIIEKETNTLIIGCQSSSIPTTVTTIGKKAFYSCYGLFSMTIPNNVTGIGAEAFSCCWKLQSILLGENVSHLDCCVFSECPNLISFYCFMEEVPSTVDNTFGDNSHNINNATLYVPETAIDKYRAASPWNQFGEIKSLSGEIATKIDSLYYDVNIDNNTATVIRPIGNQYYSGDIIIPSTVQFYKSTCDVVAIGDNAFQSSQITSVFLPGCIKSIGGQAFSHCNLNTIIVDESNTVYDSRNNCNAIIKTASNELLYGSANTIIPNDVVLIGEGAFSGRSALSSISIPNSVTSIGSSAFYNCIGLSSFSIPNSVTSIGEGAFTGCKELTSIEIPYSVVNIGGNIFGSCSSLASIKVDDNNTVYDSREQCNAIITTTTNELIAGCANTIIPNTVTSIGAGAFVGSGLKSITIPNSVTNIGPYGFGWCSSLLSVNFPERLKTISESMFIACPSLTAIVIPNNVDSIGERAFNSCTGLTSVIIGDNVKAIGMYAFAGSGVSELTIGCNVKTIYSCAFADCYNLKQLVIPNSVTLLDGWAFGHCSGLVTVILGNSVASINGAFANCDSILSITSFNPIPPNASWGFSNNINYSQAILSVPVGFKEGYQNAAGWKNFMNIEEIDIPIPNAVGINVHNFPDDKFREFLLNMPFGKDRVLTEEEIEGITSMDVSNLGISDLKGIEHFTSLKKLLCYKNKLTSLDLSANKQLTEVDCYSNQIIGSKMDSLLASLPTLNDEEGSLFVFDATNDGNICFTNQVAFANSKGWTVYYYTGHDWQKYEGREKGILIVEENFPDEYFRKYLMNQDYGKDMVITDEEIKSITFITISGDYQDNNKRYLKSLKGIEYFTSLTSLYCSYNLLTELDVSNNKELTVLCCPNNSLKSLDISSNVLLTTLVCDMNGLTKLDVSKNTSLTSLSCHHNQLTSLDITKNKALIRLTCADNKLTEIDVSKNTALTYLFCAYNQLTSLDVSKNGELTELTCMGNQLTKLDVSKNLKLTTLKCQRNNINEERMDQMIEGLPNQTSGKLYVVSSKKGDGEGGNVCTKIQVRKANEKGWEVYCGYEYLGSGPDMYYPNYQEYEGIGSVIEISEENFPDMNFRNFLLSQDYVHGGAIDSTEILNITQLIIDSKGISSLQGIEFFTALKSLNCSFNQLMLLDVSKNTALEELYCGQNSKLTTLDVSKNKELILLNTYGTPLTTLNVSGCTALQNLACYWGQLTSLDVSECPALTSLNCNGNQLTSLDVSKNTALKSLYCYWNQLTSLDVSGCTKLQYLECNGNQLTALDMSGCKALQDLVCSENQLTSLNIANNTNLQQLHCSDNKLNTLSLPVNSFMIFSFSCYQNQIKGKAMDALIESLPISNNRTFYIIYNDNDKEGNKMTTTQVAAAKAKGWTPYYTDDGKTWQEYLGEDLSGIQYVTMDKKSINVYDLNGRKLKEPSKGINIIKGKKLMVK